MTDIQKMVQMERDPEILKAKLNLETAKSPWSDLQRFFASGSVIAVSNELDLTDVALQISLDNSTQIQQWMESAQVGRVSDQQALRWFEGDAQLWTCVVKPWVLVQEGNDE